MNFFYGRDEQLGSMVIDNEGWVPLDLGVDNDLAAKKQPSIPGPGERMVPVWG